MTFVSQDSDLQVVKEIAHEATEKLKDVVRQNQLKIGSLHGQYFSLISEMHEAHKRESDNLCRSLLRKGSESMMVRENAILSYGASKYTQPTFSYHNCLHTTFIYCYSFLTQNMTTM